MQSHARLWSRLGALGIVFAALFVIANVLTAGSPGAGATGVTVVKYYRAHKATEIAAVFVAVIAVIAFTFFVGSLRHTLNRTEEGHDLGNIVTAGGAIYALGLLIMASLTVALIDAGHYRMTDAAQTLNVLAADAWVPAVVGLSLVALGTGVSALRNAILPRWLCWLSIALGILSVSGPAGTIAFLVSPVWALVVGVVIFRTRRSATTFATPYPLAAR
jgi:succinate dehydrogenase/fumarate reductase cytochrome b subunit